MRIGDIKAVTQVTPTDGPRVSLVKGSIHQMGRRAGVFESLAPVSTLKSTGSVDTFNDPILAVARGLITYIGSKESYAIGERKILKLLNNLFTVVVSPRHFSKPQFTLRPKIGDREFAVYPDSRELFITTTSDNLHLIARDVQKMIDDHRIKQVPDPFVVGLAAFDASEDVLKLKNQPSAVTSYGNHEMIMDIKEAEWSDGKVKAYYKYQMLLTVALTNMIETVDKVAQKRKVGGWTSGSSYNINKSSKQEFMSAMATYLLHSYGTTNEIPDPGFLHSANDLLDPIKTLLGAPWSQSYPFLQPLFEPDLLLDSAQADTDKLADVARVIKSILAFNIILGIVRHRIGVQVLDLEFSKLKGSSFNIRADIDYHSTPHYDAGGSQDIFYPMAWNRKQRDVIYLPWAIDLSDTKNKNLMRHNMTRKENWSTALIDRGESTVDTEFGQDVHRLLTVTRDAKVAIVESPELFTEFYTIIVPTSNKGNREPGMGFYMSYLSDGIDTPGPMLPVSGEAFLKPSLLMVAGDYGSLTNMSGKPIEMNTVTVDANDKVVTERIPAKSAPGLPSPAANAERHLASHEASDVPEPSVKEEGGEEGGAPELDMSITGGEED